MVAPKLRFTFCTLARHPLPLAATRVARRGRRPRRRRRRRRRRAHAESASTSSRRHAFSFFSPPAPARSCRPPRASRERQPLETNRNRSASAVGSARLGVREVRRTPPAERPRTRRGASCLLLGLRRAARAQGEAASLSRPVAQKTNLQELVQRAAGAPAGWSRGARCARASRPTPAPSPAAAANAPGARRGGAREQCAPAPTKPSRRRPSAGALESVAERPERRRVDAQAPPPPTLRRRTEAASRRRGRARAARTTSSRVPAIATGPLGRWRSSWADALAARQATSVSAAAAASGYRARFWSRARRWRAPAFRARKVAHGRPVTTEAWPREDARAHLDARRQGRDAFSRSRETRRRAATPGRRDRGGRRRGGASPPCGRSLARSARGTEAAASASSTRGSRPASEPSERVAREPMKRSAPRRCQRGFWLKARGFGSPTRPLARTARTWSSAPLRPGRPRRKRRGGRDLGDERRLTQLACVADLVAGSTRKLAAHHIKAMTAPGRPACAADAHRDGRAARRCRRQRAGPRQAQRRAMVTLISSDGKDAYKRERERAGVRERERSQRRRHGAPELIARVRLLRRPRSAAHGAPLAPRRWSPRLAAARPAVGPTSVRRWRERSSAVRRRFARPCAIAAPIGHRRRRAARALRFTAAIAVRR